MTTSANSGLRNIAIIAHVDTARRPSSTACSTIRHLRRPRTSRRAGDGQNDIEKERGITILAKTVRSYRGTRINIVDTLATPISAARVERVLSMVDGALLLVDAVGRPDAADALRDQKALALGHQNHRRGQ